MLAKLLKLLTVKMHQLAALFALVVKAHLFAMAFPAHIFKTSRGIIVYIVFVYDALAHHSL